MSNFRDAALKKIVRGQRVSARSLAQEVGLTPPIVLSNLIDTLENLPIQLDFSVSTATVSGAVTLILKRDGTVIYRGHVHESGGLSHHYAVLTVLEKAILPPDKTGLVPVIVAHEGEVHGTLDLGSRDDDWDLLQVDFVVRDNWEHIKKAGPSSTNLSVSTGPIEILRTILITDLGFHLITP